MRRLTDASSQNFVLDQPIVSESREMLADRGASDFQRLAQLGDRLIARAEPLEDLGSRALPRYG
jgi:hypothetical protein